MQVLVWLSVCLWPDSGSETSAQFFYKYFYDSKTSAHTSVMTVSSQTTALRKQ